MKARKIAALTLLTAIVGGATIPLTANAAESNGKVTVGAGEIKPDDPMVDPEKPNTEPGITPDTPGVHPGANKGPLGITNTTDLIFDKISTGNSIITRDAHALELADKTKRGQLVTWSDLRGSNAGYTITAAMTKQFSLADDSKKLGGATLTYTNPLLETKTINKDIAPSLTSQASSFVLGEDGTAVEVVNAAAGKGAGTYVLEFGQSADYDANNAVLGNDAIQKGVDTTANSVKLTVPAATAASMTLGDYIATVTWTIASTPTPGA
ncbi:WxL domain-containing protein [Vagococcus sp. JNUCC 83]